MSHSTTTIQDELLEFQACRTFGGDVRRTGSVPAQWPRRALSVPTVLYGRWRRREVGGLQPYRGAADLNLTAIEQLTWRQLLDRRSISDIGADQGVTRAAIYASIRGAAKRPGGMVAKNPWVAAWLSRR